MDMNLSMLSHAAEIVFRMCREHPEICPHEYSWMSTRHHSETRETREYICQLCGKTRTIEVEKVKDENGREYWKEWAENA